MATSYRKKAVLREDSVESPQNSYESVAVTITATMGNGSLLAGDTEIAVAAAATADGVLNDPKFDEGFYADKVGEVYLVPVCKRSAIVNGKVIKYTDAAYGGEALTALEAKLVRVQDAETDFSLTY